MNSEGQIPDVGLAAMPERGACSGHVDKETRLCSVENYIRVKPSRADDFRVFNSLCIFILKSFLSDGQTSKNSEVSDSLS